MGATKRGNNRKRATNNSMAVFWFFMLFEYLKYRRPKRAAATERQRPTRPALAGDVGKLSAGVYQ